MKRSYSSFVLIVVFVAGFLLGVVFSAWRLDKIMSPAEEARREAPAERMPVKESSAELEKRIAGLEKMLAMTPNNVQGLTQLANAYFDTGKFEKALETFAKAQAIDTKNPDIPTIMGVIYRRVGKPEEAVKSFKKTLEIKPDHPMALFNLGILYGKELNNPEEELKAWKAFLTLAGDNPHAAMVKQRVERLEQSAAQKGAAPK